MILKGRKKIFTDANFIDERNVISVLQNTLMTHEINRGQILFLLNYEKGEQPLVVKKTVRPEIDVRNISNLANEITEFKLGYFWGKPIAIVQKSDSIPDKASANEENHGVAALNAMYYAEGKDSKDQELGRYVEITGIGYQMIDIKRDYEDGESLFDMVTLNPLFAYVIYSTGLRKEPIMAVTYSVKTDGSRFFTCFTKDNVFEINSEFKLVGGEKKEFFAITDYNKNMLGEIPVIEFERSFDRTGCFERQISELDALNVLESNLVNDVCQTTQAIWWGNDIDLERDENGKVKGVQGGQWILTRTAGNGNKPDINSLTLSYDYGGVLENIKAKHDAILERAFVPKQSDASGGSTGSAMSMSSGWSACEAVACKEELVLKHSFQLRNRLVLKAIAKSPDVKKDNPVLKLTNGDIDVRFTRQKTYALTEKANALTTLLNAMVDPKTAMTTVDLFGDLAEAVANSVNGMKKLQEKIVGENDTEEPTEEVEVIEAPKKNAPDLSDQVSNSPIVGGVD